jgi:flagellin-like protein
MMRRKGRAVSPIIATILLVAITVVLAATLYVLVAQMMHGPTSVPLGSAFAVAGARLVTGSAGTFGAGSPCTAGDYCYTVSVVSVSNGVTFGSLEFQIVTNTGTVVECVPVPTGPTATGVAITDITGTVRAYGTGAYVTSWTYGGSPVASGTTQVVVSDGIWVDMGTFNPSSQGLVLHVFGAGAFSGSVSTMLP